MNAFTSVRPKARPGNSAGIKRPSMQHKRYPGFVLENQETSRANSLRRQAAAKASI